MTDKEVMQMALDTVQDARDYLDIVNTQAAEAKSRRLTKTLEALRTALAQGEQEPFGYFKAEPFGWTDCAETDEGAIPLYERPVAPPQRPWQGLTDEEINTIAATPAAIPGSYVHSFARAIEAKLKEKNT